MMLKSTSDRCPNGIDPLEWRIFLRLVKTHQAIALSKHEEVQAAMLAYSKQRRPW